MSYSLRFHLALLLLCLLTAPAFAANVPDPGPARLVSDLALGTAPAYQALSGFASVGNRSVFLRVDNEYLALWVTDGTSRGTTALGVLCPPCGNASLLGSTGNLAFYLVSEGYPDLNQRLWRTDGTPAGTFPVTETFKFPLNGPGFLSSLAGNRLFFTACTPALGCEPWSSDGTRAGTAPVGEIVPGPESGTLRGLAAHGDQAFLTAVTPSGGLALWHADGATRRLKLLKETPQARSLVAAGPNRAFFIAQDAGFEVWTSDGTAAGTRPLTNFTLEEPFGGNYLAKFLAGRFYFSANDGSHGNELWSVGAGGEGLKRLTDFGDGRALVTGLEKSGSRILFLVSQRNGRKIWTSRGDLASTGPLTGCSSGCPAPKKELVDLGNGRFALYGSDRRGDGFWVTDGTAAGTRLLKRPGGQHDLVQSVEARGRALFEITNEYELGELWITDGSAAGTALAGHGGPKWSHYYGWVGPLWGGAAGGRVVFPALSDDPAVSEALWSSNGTAGSSRPLFQALAGVSSQPRQLGAFGDGLLLQDCAKEGEVELRFVGGTKSTSLLKAQIGACTEIGPPPLDLGSYALQLLYGPDGIALWRTDGTTAGTVAIVPAAGPDEPDAVARFGEQGAFWLTVPLPGNQFQGQIWATDGTRGGTRKLVDFPHGVLPNAFTGLGGKLYFFHFEGQGENFAWRPWASDGTPGGTAPLTPPLTLGASDLRYTDLTFVELDGRVYFPLVQGGGGVEIWSTDGTPAGTGPAITEASGMVKPEARTLASADGRLYFAAHRVGDPSGPLLPWVSDGTDGGTRPLAQVDLRRDTFGPLDTVRFVELNGRVFFTASDPAHGEELWATDGSPAGTALVRDITPGPFGSYPRNLVFWQDRLWFRARDASRGMELWSTDGSAQGTRLVQDIAPGASWSVPTELTPAGENLYFSANDGTHGRELWVLPASALDP